MHGRRPAGAARRLVLPDVPRGARSRSSSRPPPAARDAQTLLRQFPGVAGLTSDDAAWVEEECAETITELLPDAISLGRSGPARAAGRRSRRGSPPAARAARRPGAAAASATAVRRRARRLRRPGTGQGRRRTPGRRPRGRPRRPAVAEAAAPAPACSGPSSAPWHSTRAGALASPADRHRRRTLRGRRATTRGRGGRIAAGCGRRPPTQRLTRVPPPPRPAPVALAERPAAPVEHAREDPAGAPTAGAPSSAGSASCWSPCGLVVLLFVVYELWITDLFTARDQSQLSDQLHAHVAGRPPGGRPRGRSPRRRAGAVRRPAHPAAGRGLPARRRRGHRPEPARRGPGPLRRARRCPGEQGNLALAGHRVGKGSPFLDLDTMRPGDPIVVETATQLVRLPRAGRPGDRQLHRRPQRIPGQEVVRPDRSAGHLARRPDAAATAPATGAYLTLTTCNPKFSARHPPGRPRAARRDAGQQGRRPDGPPALPGYH